MVDVKQEEIDIKIEGELKDEPEKKIKKEISQINKWWEQEDIKEECKWEQLEHHGVEFPCNYRRHHQQIYRLVDKAPIPMNIKQEEMATYWCQSLASEQANNPIYINNFNSMFMQSLGNSMVQHIDQIDFTQIKLYLEQQAEQKKKKSQEQKKEEKEKKEKKENYYGTALVDGVSEKVGGFLIEAPTLFKGRGQHPKAGLMKARIMPEDVTINIMRSAAVPRCSMKGHCWKDIVHNNEVTWLAFYKDDTINTNYKYIFLSAASKFKGLNDRRKYEKARQLKRVIHSVRKDYQDKLTHSIQQNRQLGTAVYLIDQLALRVGNDKSEEEADTVGCCSLRVEHLQLSNDNQITLDFLGKDSMRYLNTVKVQKEVYNNLESFMIGKAPHNDLFDKINASVLNDYLRSLMPGLTAKVFRTYNASHTLEQELHSQTVHSFTLEQKVDYYDNANKQVAILCNHQKTVGKNFDSQLVKQKDKINVMAEYLAELQQLLGAKQSQLTNRQEIVYLAQQDQDNLKKTNQFVKKFPAEKAKIQPMIDKLTLKIAQEQQKTSKKESNKNIALGTSKINYNDPRITVVWCKQNEVPIEKVFTKNLRIKFPWAMYTEPSWRF